MSLATPDLDLALLANACAGDPAAFGAVIRIVDHDLRGVVWAVVRTNVDTDDVMQTAYEKAFRSIGAFDQRSSIKTWLHSICYRAAIDHVRYEGRRRHQSDDVLRLVEAPGSVADSVVARSGIAEAFGVLDEEQRVLLMMVAGLGMSFDEVAEVMDMRRGTVASKVGRARTKLQREEWT